MLDCVDHILVAVRDLDAGEEHYTRLLGRLACWRGSHPGGGTSNVIFRLENTYLELIAATGEGALADRVQARLQSRGEGLLGVALGTAHAQRAATVFRERALEVTGPLPGESRHQDGTQSRTWQMVTFSRECTRGLFLFVIEQADRLALPFSVRAAQVEGRAAVDGVDHLVINTPDPEGLTALLEGQLGLPLRLDQTRENWGVRQLFFRLGGVTLEAITPIEEGKRPKTDHLWGLALRVPDVEAARNRIEASGLAVSPARTGRKKDTAVATVKEGTLGVPTLLIGPGLPGQG